MSDVAVIHIKGAVCGIYLHWAPPNKEIGALIQKALPRMRHDDEDYSMARLIGELHKEFSGNTGLGVVSPAFHDGRVFDYDCHSGVLEGPRYFCSKNIGVPPK